MLYKFREGFQITIINYLQELVLQMKFLELFGQVSYD